MGPDLIDIDSHGTAIPTEVFRSAGKPDATIVLVHGSDGVNEPWAALIREYATDLAGRGFATFIPRYFVKTNTDPGPGVFVQIRVGTRIIMGQVTHCAPLRGEFQVTFEIESIFLIPRRESLSGDPGTGET